MRLRAHVAMFVIASCAVVCNSAAFVINLTLMPEEPALRIVLATMQIFLAVWMFVIARRAWCFIHRIRLRNAINARIVRGDVQLKCELVYLGVRGELHTWMIVAPRVLEGDRLMIDMLPARTSIISL